MGEGNFHVKKDQKHPFIVKTSSLKIKVLGTKFNVCAYGNEDKTVTTLESGSVMIQKPTEEPITVLSPNEQLEYHNTTGEFQKRKIDASIYSGWTKGELNFVSQSLKEIVKSLERTYNVHILLPPTLNTTDLYTIKFKHQSSINDVLNIITKTIGNLSYTIEDDNMSPLGSIRESGIFKNCIQNSCRTFVFEINRYFLIDIQLCLIVCDAEFGLFFNTFKNF